MVTARFWALGLVIGLSGCGFLVTDGGGTSGAAATGDPKGEEPVNDAAIGSDAGSVTTEPAYSGKGFVVHEWGTNTVVVGSDGSLQRGLQHEEEDLPEFVFDRMKQASASVAVKMETPVTYFYSDAPRTVNVGVGFPRGLFSQWYPQVRSFTPGLERTATSFLDPFTDASYPYANSVCRDRALTPKNGLLDWGAVQILARGESPALLDAPLDRYTWSFARNVAANSVRVGTAAEKFLFYRGLGNLPMGVTITSTLDGAVRLQNNDAAHAVGAVFVLRVTNDRAAFVVHPEGISGSGTLDEVAPAATLSLDQYARDLGNAMSSALERSGLYRDEARAMVDTWSRQWFRTPGVRVLYIAPQVWTEEQIPLTVTPAPDRMVRVMVIRNEILTPVLEDEDLKFVALFDSDATTARAHFASLGRFAEPRLRRALAKLGSTPASAATYLAALEGVNATTSH